MAVHLDIRPRLPRLGLPPEPPAARRKRWRLPPLAVPAAGYWVLMGGLTYFFAHLGPHPLEALADPLEPAASEAAPPAPREVATPEPAPVAATAPSIPPSIVDSEPAPAAEPPPAVDEAAFADARGSRRSPPDAALALARAPSPAPTPSAASSFAATPQLTFPEFTDSSLPAPRARAADGPRIDSLFEHAGDRPALTENEAAPPEVGAAVAVSSCEAAIARNNEQIELGAPRAPADITREAYAGILQNGRYLAGCSIPDRTVLQVCAAVKDGRAVGITVSSNPSSSALNACVKSAVSRLKFPASPKLDVTHTRFDAIGR